MSSVEFNFWHFEPIGSDIKFEEEYLIQTINLNYAKLS